MYIIGYNKEFKLNFYLIIMKVDGQYAKDDIRLLRETKALERICNKLIEKGVPKRELDNLSEDAGYAGIPGGFGHRASQLFGGLVFLGFGVLGVYLGNKINGPNLLPKIIGGFLGFTAYLGAGALAEDGENTPLITSLIKKYPGKLREAYSELGFSLNEINEIFDYDRIASREEIFYN